MSRSVHTRPHQILAAARVRAPYAARWAGDPHGPHAALRQLKLDGFGRGAGPAPGLNAPAPLPRLYVQRPQPGFIHPVSLTDIARLLRFFGEKCTYGLRSVELVQGRPIGAGASLAFGRLLVPGRILLYAQPPPPWRLRGRVPAPSLHKVERAGAEVELAGAHTIIFWPGRTLREFMLFEVLMHEVGHHIMQQYKGKRTIRVVRSRDHEAFTERFAAQCRRQFEDSRLCP